MLLAFLILFANVLADNKEDKYVDLLPDEEKQQFLEKVARRILKDVESQENVKDAQSGEPTDEQLKQHTEYVKAVLKEEQENVRRSKGSDVKDTERKPDSDEKETLGVKPLRTEKVYLPDLTLREEKRDIASDGKNNITIEMVTDNAPIIKRSVQDDNASNSYESDETTYETFYKVTKTNVTSDESNEATNEKVENDNVATEANVLSGKGLQVNESTTASDENNESKSVDSNQSISSESGAHNVSVKCINESLLRRSNSNDSILAGKTTESNTTTSTVVSVKSTENKSGEYNNVSNGNEEFTTLKYLFQSSSIKNKNTTTESTTSDTPVLTATITTNKDKHSKPLRQSTNFTSQDTENKVGTRTKNTRTSIFTDEKTTESVPTTTDFVPETTELVPVTMPDTEAMTTKAVTESPTVLFTTENTSTPVVMTKDPKVVVEDFKSAPTITTSVQFTTLKPRKTTKKKKKPVSKQRALSKEFTTVAPGSDEEESIEATTKKIFKHTVVIYKPQKYIAGPKAKKITEAEKDGIQNKNFIELEQHYYDNNYNVKIGKQYHVFEIPPDNLPFIKYEEPIADQPYYVPLYNYSAKNAYFNPKNRLGPNAGDSIESNNAIFNDVDDDIDQLDKTKTLNYKMEYDRTSDSKKKKFGSKQRLSHNIHKQPLQNNEHISRGKIRPKRAREDYLDSDYYFGIVRKELARRIDREDLAKFPNSDETDHPARSIQEGSLKDHVRAVRNILFHQKFIGLLEKDKYGKDVVNELRMGRVRSEAKHILRKGQDEDSNDNDKYNNITINYYIGREKPSIESGINQDGINNIHVQKVGYLKKKNYTKELYVMDDFFKANVEKYIQENGFTPAPQHPYHAKTTNLDKRDEVNAYLRDDERYHKTENYIKTSVVKRDGSNNEEITNATQNQADIPNENNTTEKAPDVKLNLRRNDVINVSVYLQVLKDMVTLDNKALNQYDWLGTTVDIQAALQKLFEITALVANKEDVHPADMEILKYVLFLHKLATEIFEANDFGAQLRKKLVLPRKMKLKRHLIKDKGLINKVWLYLRKEVPQINENGALKHLNKFLMGVEDGLYDLHDTIKNIAKITKYKNQHWYQNLKDLYINTDEKHLLELLLHVTSLRFFSLIERSAKNGLEDDYIQYMKKNWKHSKRTLEEMMFVMEILEEYNKFVE